jgi:flagellar motor switch protein FliN
MDKPETPSPEAEKAEDRTEAQSIGDALTAGAAGQRRGDDVFPQLDSEDTLNAIVKRAEEGGTGINAMLNVGLDVQIVLGHTRMPISRLLELTRGSIVELNRKIGAPVDLMVSNRLVARGDLVKVGEDRLGVSLTQIVKDHAPD